MMNLKKKMIRLRYLWIVVPLLAGLWFAWPSASKDGGTAGSREAPAARTSGGGTAAKSLSPTPGAAPGQRHPSRVRERPATSPASVQVDRILANDDIGTTQAAAMLHELAADTSLPLEDRLEALQHGLNLDITRFAGFAETPDLPAELAAEFLDAVINENEAPEFQIQSYLALLNHPDPEVAESAADMLAFLVEDDLNEADPATLVQLAQRKLEELRQAPPDSR